MSDTGIRDLRAAALRDRSSLVSDSLDEIVSMCLTAEERREIGRPLPEDKDL